MAIFCAHISFLGTDLSRSISNAILDKLFKQRGLIASPSEVAVVLLTEKTYKAAGISPRKDFWPRQRLADLVNRIHSFGATAIAFDFMLDEASEDPSGDIALRNAIATIPSVLAAETPRSIYDSTYRELYVPLKEFSSVARSVGLVDLSQRDNVVREFPHANNGFNAFAVAAATLFRPVHLPKPRSQNFINFYGPSHGKHTAMPIYDINDIMSATPPDLHGKLVFIGLGMQYTTRGASRDAFSTPYDEGPTFGVILHAIAAGNLIAQDWIESLSIADENTLSGLVVAFMTALFVLTSPSFSGAILLALSLSWAFGSYFCFRNNFFLPGAQALITLFPVFSYAAFYHFGETKKLAAVLSENFKRYIPAPLVAQVQANRKLIQPGGQIMDVSIVFIDLKGFTSLAEKFKNGGLIELLSRYFGTTHEIVERHMGTKLEGCGDSAYYVWGAPLPVPHADQKAIDAALEARSAFKQMCAAEGAQPSGFRIGVHRGPAEVGNIGSPTRFQFTAVHDTVNTGARLDALSKTIGIELLLSGTVLQGTTHWTQAFYLGDFIFVNKSVPIATYCLPESPVSQQLRKLWMEGQRRLRQRQWDCAWKIFQQISRNEPYLKETAYFILGRINDYSNVPPPPTWNGAIVIPTK